MNRDDPAAQRLIDFCMRLPQIAGEPSQAQADTRWVLQQFQRRRAQLTETLGSAAVHEHERPVLRCEIDALDAASSVLNQLWQRRFGAALGA
jgi:hypothetical protein